MSIMQEYDELLAFADMEAHGHLQVETNPIRILSENENILYALTFNSIFVQDTGKLFNILLQVRPARVVLLSISTGHTGLRAAASVHAHNCEGQHDHQEFGRHEHDLVQSRHRPGHLHPRGVRAPVIRISPKGIQNNFAFLELKFFVNF